MLILRGVGIKNDLLVAQIFRHGDDLRSIKELILVILITHVSFAGAALTCKEEAAFVSLGCIYQNLAQLELSNINHKPSNKW